MPVHFDAETVQTFYVGPASCGVPGTAVGLVRALERFGSVPLAELVGPGMRLAREGAPVNAEQAYILDILAPIHERLDGTRELYAPGGRLLREGDVFRFGELGEALERFGAEGAEPFCRGEVAAALSDFVVENGGTLGRGDFAAYEAIERKPIRAPFRGAEVLTNPPPSSGGILIAYSPRAAGAPRASSSGPEQLVAAMDAANRQRGIEFAEALYEEGMEAGFLDPAGLDLAAGDLLGSTTHISVLDGDGMCASVTCSNGSGSGVLVPGTGVILNNMLGEEDLNPLGFHRIAPGRRVPSMMAPTVVLRDGEIVLGVGSAGSNRIRSAILQTVVRAVEQELPVAAAVEAPRLHFEGGVLQAEPGIDEAALARLEAGGLAVARRPEINLFFGGVQAVARDPRDRRPQRRRRPAPRRRRRLRLTLGEFEVRIAKRTRNRGRRMPRWPPLPRSISRPRGCSTTSTARPARLASTLLRELAADGVSLEELREAVNAGRLALLPVERALAGHGRRYTAREIAEIAGIDLEQLRRFSAALGVPYTDPDEPRGTEADLEAARRMKAFRDAGLPEEGMLQVARTIGMGTARIAEANRELVIKTLAQPGDSERDLALRFAARGRVHDAAGRPDPRPRPAGEHARADPPRRDRHRRPRLRRPRRHRQPHRLLRRPGRVHPPRRGDPGRGAGPGRRPPGRDGQRRRRTAGAPGEDDRRRGDVRLHRAGGDADGRAWP